VAKSQRGKGIGTQMLQKVFAFAKTRNAARVTLEVIDTNTEARKLYERLGFTSSKTTRYGLLTQRAGFKAIHHMARQI